MSEHKILKFQEKEKGPPKKYTAHQDILLERTPFLGKEFSGDYAYSDKVSKKQYIEMVQDKGMMLYEILKDAEFKNPSAPRTTRHKRSTLISPQANNRFEDTMTSPQGNSNYKQL